MTDEQMRIAIAESVGYKELFMDNGKSMIPQRWESPYDEFCYVAERLPDYLNDLNAMHEAEKTLLTQCGNDPQDDLWIDYLANLLHAATFCLREHATARQRAEAFIKTLNLEPK